MSIDLLAAIQTNRETGTNRYVIELAFISQILGTQPRSKDAMRSWLESKHLDEETIAKQQSQLPAEERIADDFDLAWTTFFADDLGPYIGTYQIKANIREMMTTLGITVEKRGSKQTFQHLLEVWGCDASGVVLSGVQSERLHFERDGVIVPKVDGFVEKAAHVMTAQGPRSTLKRHDYIEGARLRFLLAVPARLPDNRKTAVVGDDEVARIFAHSGNDGLGCSRSQGFGRFQVVRCERITDNPAVLPKKGKPAATDADLD